MMVKPKVHLSLLCLLISLWTTPIYPKSYEDVMIPADHKAKNWLDKLFQGKRYPHSKKELMKIGFRNFTRPDSKGALVFKHRGCRGYLFKLYTNKDGAINEARVLAKRIKGANVIRQYIIDHGYQEYFKVPKKWLYQYKTSSHYILVVEDMNILSRDAILKRWKSSKMTESLLQALMNTLSDLGLIDSIYIDNIPFSKDGKISFIDTEHFHSNQRIRFEVLNRCLSKKLLPFWLEITRQ